MLTLILHNIRSVHNVGSIFRTADAAGVSKIILSGYTPSPLDRFGRARKDFVKVSLGAEASVPWEVAEDITLALEQLKKDSCKIVALEQSPNSTPLFDYKPEGNIALIVGNEVDGVEPALLKIADTIVEIPMRGQKESLNVSVATGVALFALVK